MSLSTSDDRELIARYQNSGDEKIIVELFKRYELKIFRICMQILKNAKDAEDAAVDIYIELTKKLKDAHISNYGAWLYVVCKNHALKKLNAKSRTLFAEEIFSRFEVKSNEKDDHQDRLIEKLPDAIDLLEEEQRWCIVLFYLHKKSYKEIEDIRGYDFKKVKSSIQHGKKNLLKILEKQRNESV